MPEPKLPSDSDIAECLAALNSTQENVRTTDDRVFDALADYWREHNRSPTGVELSRVLSEKRNTVVNSICRLIEKGRVLRPNRGCWIPDCRSKGAQS